jgi:hypothetical protein
LGEIGKVVSMSKVYPFHPLASRYPVMRKWSKVFKALVKDIGRHGLHEAIVLYEDKVLDGRNRMLACQVAGVEPHYRQFDPATEGDPAAFVESANSHRRHLSPIQRAQLADKDATGTSGGDRRSEDFKTANLQLRTAPTVEEAAATHGVSPRSVYSFREACKTARAEVVQAVFEGRVGSIRRLTKIAKLSEDEQIEAVKDWEKIRDEHPGAFEHKRGSKTKISDFARWFDDQSDEEKERVWRIVDLWWRAHRGAV